MLVNVSTELLFYMSSTGGFPERSQSGSKQRNRRRADGVRGRAMQVPGQIEKVWERAGIYACSSLELPE